MSQEENASQQNNPKIIAAIYPPQCESEGDNDQILGIFLNDLFSFITDNAPLEFQKSYKISNDYHYHSIDFALNHSTIWDFADENDILLFYGSVKDKMGIESPFKVFKSTSRRIIYFLMEKRADD